MGVKYLFLSSKDMDRTIPLTMLKLEMSVVEKLPQKETARLLNYWYVRKVFREIYEVRAKFSDT